MLSCSDSAVALKRPLTGWWWNREERTDKQSRNSSFLSFLHTFMFFCCFVFFTSSSALLRSCHPFGICKLLTVHLPAGAWPSPWRSLTDSITLPICSLSANTCYPPTLRHPPPIPLQHISSSVRLFRGSWDGVRTAGRGGESMDKWWGSWKCMTARRFITIILKTFSAKTVHIKIISISAG